jgi:hypothetical protein
MTKKVAVFRQPVGLVEIAERLGYPRTTAKTWHQRGVLPGPGPGLVSGAPWWDLPVILEWAEKTGRLREDSA